METTTAILASLIKALGDNYAEQLAALPIKKNVREILIDGYRAGVGDGVRHVIKLLGVEVVE